MTHSPTKLLKEGEQVSSTLITVQHSLGSTPSTQVCIPESDGFSLIAFVVVVSRHLTDLALWFHSQVVDLYFNLT